MINLAIIPARGGSKRIPNKNIRNFLGRPIISYPINAALKSKLFDDVIVSTDSNMISQVAKDCGASVPFMRSKKNSSDTATTVDVLLEVIAKYSESTPQPIFVCCIYPTAPFVTPEILAQSQEMITSDDRVDSVVPVVEYPNPIQRAFKLAKNRLEFIDQNFMFTSSQNIEPRFYDPGQFYLLRVKSLLEQQKLFMDFTKPIIVKETQVQDINTLEDWKLAELKYQL